MANRVLEIDLSRCLPDVNRMADVPQEYESYGRVAILRSGALWFGPAASSHPPTTLEGFYWALCGNVLYISPRGAAGNWKGYITDEVIRFICVKLSLKGKFRHFRVRQDDNDKE